MRFLTMTGCLLVLASITANADITAQMNLSSPVKIALQERTPVKIQSNDIQQSQSIHTLEDCKSFHYTQNICEMVKSYLARRADSL